MNEDLRNIVLGVVAAGISASLGWFARNYLWRRALRRKRAFFGLPRNSECLLVVNREAGSEGAVHRFDVFALLELSALVKDCGAHAQIIHHDVSQQGFGERTEFCVGGPYSNRRMAAHLSSLLPGVKINTDVEPGPDRGAFQIGSERYRLDAGTTEYVLLARLTAGEGGRPVFLFCGQRAITNQAATRYLARHHVKLARKHGANPFVLLLKVVNTQAYGPDVVELVADVTRAAQAPAPTPAPAPAPATRKSHRAAS
ncbi:hypothetical protein ABZ611_32700 [Streptomyces sp. NPDC007861]|uniref:hypothetical protein n=1 Tax=Streptomyces sp. NPDC007861 TaxID=3154893 RepID=UPI0033ED9252